jgi:hypothetical protein
MTVQVPWKATGPGTFEALDRSLRSQFAETCLSQQASFLPGWFPKDCTNDLLRQLIEKVKMVCPPRLSDPVLVKNDGNGYQHSGMSTDGASPGSYAAQTFPGSPGIKGIQRSLSPKSATDTSHAEQMGTQAMEAPSGWPALERELVELANVVASDISVEDFASVGALATPRCCDKERFHKTKPTKSTMSERFRFLKSAILGVLVWSLLGGSFNSFATTFENHSWHVRVEASQSPVVCR